MTYPPAIFAIGRNYAAHAAEMKAELPERPLVFMKNPASVVGNGEPIVIPPVCAEGGEQVDYEGELAIIIERDACDVPEADVLGVIGGYAVANDVSARWWQKHGAGGQFVRGKSFNTFCPMTEPVPVTSIEDPQMLQLETRLNGDLVQSSSTSDMIFPVAEIVSELSRGTTLLAGTVILTGTPAGVGAGQTPPRFLREGDVVQIAITGVGTLRNTVVNG